jgi:hypothetical protein
MVDVVNRDQCIDARGFCRFQFGKLEATLVFRECVERIAHQPDRRLAEIDDLVPGTMRNSVPPRPRFDRDAIRAMRIGTGVFSIGRKSSKRMARTA